MTTSDAVNTDENGMCSLSNVTGCKIKDVVGCISNQCPEAGLVDIWSVTLEDGRALEISGFNGRALVCTKEGFPSWKDKVWPRW